MYHIAFFTLIDIDTTDLNETESESSSNSNSSLRQFRRNPQQQQQPNTRQRPVFVLHVGPPKTATTTIQCGLEEHAGRLASDDSTYFVGKRCQDYVLKGGNETMSNGEVQIEGHHLMMGLIGGNEKSRGIEQLKLRMDYHNHHHNNMIYSLEAMSPRLQDRPEVWRIFRKLFEG